MVRPKVDNIRKLAAEQGRDPRSIKFFGTFTPIIGRTREEAQAKLRSLQETASTIGGLVLFSGWTGIDISKIPLDQEITAADSKEANKITSVMSAFTTTSKEHPRWTPRTVAEHASIGGLGPVTVGTPADVADEMERWIKEGDLDGFNLAYVTTPGTFEDVVELLVPELRRRGVYPEKIEDGLTAREKVHGKGQNRLRDDHAGSAYKYNVYQEDAPYAGKEEKSADEALEAEFNRASATTGAAQLDVVDGPKATLRADSAAECSGAHGDEQVAPEDGWKWPRKEPLPRELFVQWPRP